MPYRFAYLIEQTLGHVTHAQNLAACVARDASIESTWLPVAYRSDDRIGRMPIIGRNWTMKLSLRARAALRLAGGAERFDALFFHTQVTAHASLGLMRRVPTIVSLDATPIGRAAIEAQTLRLPPRRVSSLTRLWTAAVFRRAALVVAWSRWAADSVTRDYAIDGSKVRVIPPGVDVNAWQARLRTEDAGTLPRVVFVGGDFDRKGGPALIAALKDDAGRTCEIDLVTSSGAVQPGAGVRVHRGLTPNSPALRDLVARCDIFALPTKKDFTPLAILEAMACGLPVVATSVGGIPEQVEHGVSGLIVPPNDEAALRAALRALLTDPARRIGMGRAGRGRVERLFCGDRNAGTLSDLMKQLADERRPLAKGVGAKASPTHS